MPQPEVPLGVSNVSNTSVCIADWPELGSAVGAVIRASSQISVGRRQYSKVTGIDFA